MKRRLLSILLAAALLCALLPQITLSARAEDVSGTCGENLTCTLDRDTGVLTITGTGAMNNFWYSSVDPIPPWYEYRDEIETVTIMNGATIIGNWAFRDCSNMTSITISDSVTSIGSRAFEGCTSLTSMTIPDSVTSIGYGAFYGCSSLTSVTIPDSVTSIGNGAFYGCSSLISVTIPDSLTSIDGLFNGCSSLTSVTIPNSVTSIEQFAFSGCSSLTSISIPDSVKYISDYSFYGCSSLIDMTIPDSVMRIGNHAFDRCCNLTSVTIPDSVTDIGRCAFSSCSRLTNVVIPGSVTNIGCAAFFNCSDLTSVTIPNSVASIGSAAFYGCSCLTSVTILNSKCIIDNSSYTLGNASTTTIHGFAGSTAEAYSAQYGYSFLKLEEPSDVAGACGDDLTWMLNGDTGELSISGTGPMNDWSLQEDNRPPWYDYRVQIKNVSIPNGVTSIGNDAFRDCINLTDVTIPDSVTSIGAGAFRDCSSLTNAIILNPECSIFNNRDTMGLFYTTTIYGFSGSTAQFYARRYGFSFLDLEAPATVSGVCGDDLTWTLNRETGGLIISGIGAMNDYGSKCPWDAYRAEIKTVTISDGVTSIGRYAFRYCRNLTSVTISDEVTCIGDYAFSECSSLTSITIPESVISIGSGAFDYCTALTSVTIPDSVKNLGYGTFYHCSSLTSVAIPDGVTSIDGTFSFCSVLTSVTIPDSVTSIGNGSFCCCTVLRNVTIPDSVTFIDDDAFLECTCLSSVTIPDSVTFIGDYAFWDCSSLKSVTILNPECVIYPNYITLGSADITTIYGYTGSTAQSYAGAYGYAFVPLESAQYQVHFDANGGEGEMDDLSMAYGVSAALTGNVFTRTGCTFIGWNTAADGSGTAYYDGETVGNLAVEGTVTLYAQWQAKPAPQYSIAWSFGGSVPTVTVTLTWSDGEVKTVPAAVTPNQTQDSVTYTACAEVNGVSYESSRTVQRSYTVTVTGGEITSGQKDSYSYGDQIIVTAGPAPEGKVFAGWYLDGALVSTSEVYGHSVDRSFTLEAAYTDQPVEIRPVATASAAQRVYVESTGKYKTTLSVSWSVPNGYKLVEAGLIRAYGTSEPSLDALVSGGTKKASTLKNANGTYNLGLTMAASKKDSSLYYVGYLTCKSSDGKTVTIYTDIGCNEPVRD